MDTTLETRKPSRPPKRWSRLRILGIVAVFLGLSLGLVFYVHDVSTVPTAEDRAYVARFLALYDIRPADGTPNYDDELRLIKTVQEGILKHTPAGTGIAESHKRELKDLYEARHGLCYDRSRSIETILTVLGFEVRHISIFQYTPGANRLRTLMKSGLPSHAITEVKTSKGWLVVDSNKPWVSLDSALTPIPLEEFQSHFSDYEWEQGDVKPSSLLLGKFIRVYGLYSRHGRFYPPFNFIPDVSWGHLLDNI